MRSSPHGGIHSTVGRAASACSRRVPASPPRRRLVQRDEPLLGGPEERRVLAAPAVGIGVGERHLGDQRPPLLQERDDPRVRVPDREPGEVGDLGDEAPVVVDRVVDRQPERPSELVVLLAMARGDVDQAGPRVHRDERGRRDPAGALDPGVPVLEPRELGPLEGPEAARGREPRHPEDLVGEARGHDERLVTRVEGHVLLARVHRDGEVGREGPGGRRPDDDRLARGVGEPGRGRHQRELHVDRRGLLLLVLHLRLGERRLAVHAPVDGLQPLVDETPADEASELAHDGRLVRGRHRQVRMRPVAEDPEPPELAALDVDELERVGPAAPALLGRIHGAAHVASGLVEPELLVDLMLDGQAVAIPAGHVDGIVAEHRPGLDHDVLEDLVERSPHVDVPVRVGRAVVENPARAALPAGAKLAVEVAGVPAAEELRLPLGQVRPHGEVGPGKVEGRLVVHESENCAAAARRAVDESVASMRTCVKEHAVDRGRGRRSRLSRPEPPDRPAGRAGEPGATRSRTPPSWRRRRPRCGRGSPPSPAGTGPPAPRARETRPGR